MKINETCAPLASRSLPTDKLGKDRRWTLPEVIRSLHDQGRLPTPFGVADIHSQVSLIYSPAYLSVVLANYCERTGDYVLKGARPRFRRVSRGRYIVLQHSAHHDNECTETRA